MGNVLEFFIKMKDLMSGGLVKIAQTSQKSFSQVTTHIDQVYDHLGKVQSKLKDVDGAAKNSDFFNGAMFKRLAVAATAALSIGAASSFVKSSVDAAMEFGATKKTFEVLARDPAKGQALADRLNKLQQDTILGPEVFKNAQTMMSFGIGINEVEKDLKELGDVSMGNKEKFSSLTLAFSQTRAAGRLMGQDLLQYINAGFNPLQTMSERWKDFGFSSAKTVGDLKGMMEGGQISAAMVAKAFELATGKGGIFENMMEKIAETPFGKLQILEGQFESMKIKLGEAFMPLALVVMQVLDKLMDIANLAMPYIQQGVQWLLDGFNQILKPSSEWAFWIALVQRVMGTVWDTLSYIIPIIWGIVKGVLQWMGQSEILRDVALGIVKAFELVGWTIKLIFATIETIWNTLIKPILTAIDEAYTKLKSLLGFKSNNTQKFYVSNEASTLIKAAVTPTKANSPTAGNKPGATPTAPATDTAKGIAGGGPRVINISLGKFFDNIVIHASNTDEALQNVEGRMQEMLLRILNSGAAVQ